MSDRLIDPLAWNDWHVVGDEIALRNRGGLRTRLLETWLDLSMTCESVVVRRDDGGSVHHQLRYGLVWACLGNPVQDVLDVPEAKEPDRLTTVGGGFTVRASAARLVENFLDLGHLPFVHQGYLGAEPQTAVEPYDVTFDRVTGVKAVGCKMFQPMASPAAKGGYVVDYIFRVERPYSASLYKANPIHPDRFDVIHLFCQPVDEETSIGHTLITYVADGTDEKSLRWFMQLIFLQDKPILENQVPKRLPLGPRMEMPVLADKTSVAYRRWLDQLGIRYGVIRPDAA